MDRCSLAVPKTDNFSSLSQPTSKTATKFSGTRHHKKCLLLAEQTDFSSCGTIPCPSQTSPPTEHTKSHIHYSDLNTDSGLQQVLAADRDWFNRQDDPALGPT